MPLRSVPSRRGNPYRDVYGQFCSRRVWELTRVARNTGNVSSGYYITAFVIEANRQNITVAEAQMLNQDTILTMMDAPSWIASHAHNQQPTDPRVAGRNALVERSSENILNTPGVLENILAYLNLRLHERREYPGRRADSNVLYWIEVPNGDRFAIRQSTMLNFLAFAADGPVPSARHIRSWLDDWASEADFASERLENLLNTAQSIGIPNYHRGHNIPQEQLNTYNRDDIESLESYVRAWVDASEWLRSELRQGGVAVGCNCPECNFANYEINYGEYRAARHLTDNPGLIECRPSTTEVMTWRPRRDPVEGYYNHEGNWVEGRRPAAHTRSDNGSETHPSRNTYDGFLSPENFQENDDDDYDETNNYDDRARYGIQAWNYKAPLEFFGEGNLFFGFENEVCAPYESAVAVAADLRFITKYDGSVHGGYEIVSQPMSWDYIKSNPEALAWVPGLRDAGGQAGRNGLHVHISRAGFASDWHRYKFIKMWMAPENYTEVKAFNRRHNNEYASPFTRLTNYRMARRINVEEGSRYCLTNVQNHETIEMRGPASTLNRLKLLGTLAGFAASVEYCRTLSGQQVALGALHWSAFIQWAVERPEYAEFVRYLEVLIEEGAAAEVYPTHTRELVNA